MCIKKWPGSHEEHSFGCQTFSNQIPGIQLIICGALGKVLRRRRWHPTPVLLPGKFHGRRSLVGCSPWGHEKSDTTERLHFHFSLSCIGEGNGNTPVFLPGESQGQGSLVGCRLWVAQSQTRLKRLSSSSSSSSNSSSSRARYLTSNHLNLSLVKWG